MYFCCLFLCFLPAKAIFLDIGFAIKTNKAHKQTLLILGKKPNNGIIGRDNESEELYYPVNSDEEVSADPNL